MRVVEQSPLAMVDSTATGQVRSGQMNDRKAARRARQLMAGTVATE